MADIRRVVPNIVTERVADTRDFYVEVLGFDVVYEPEDMVFLASPTNPTAQVQLHRDDVRWEQKLFVTVEVADVDAVHATALERGLDIVEPLHDIPEQGVRRFQLLDPNGVMVNVMTHTSVP